MFSCKHSAVRISSLTRFHAHETVFKMKWNCTILGPNLTSLLLYFLEDVIDYLFIVWDRLLTSCKQRRQIDLKFKEVIYASLCG